MNDKLFLLCILSIFILFLFFNTTTTESLTLNPEKLVGSPAGSSLTSCQNIPNVTKLESDIHALETYITTGEFNMFKNTVPGKAFSNKVAALRTSFDGITLCNTGLCNNLYPNSIWDSTSCKCNPVGNIEFNPGATNVNKCVNVSWLKDWQSTLDIDSTEATNLFRYKSLM